MSPFRPGDERVPPEPRRVSDVAITRFDHIYEVDPALMTEHVRQHPMPNWDTLRLADARGDHLAWMHRLFADRVVSAQALLDALTDE